MFTNTIDPDHFLTPSEVVFLNGEKFAKKVTLGNIELMHTDAKVSQTDLGLAILMAAVLADEQVGAFRLETQERKAMLGLRKVRKLFAIPATPSQALPEHSLEATFSALAAQLTPQEDDDISTLFYVWLGEDSFAPWNTAFERLKAGMAQRGLLEAAEEKKLKVFTVTNYTLPERTARLLQGQSSQPVKALLENCQRARPEVWKLLESGIKKAISDRTEKTDTDTDFS